MRVFPAGSGAGERLATPEQPIATEAPPPYVGELSEEEQRLIDNYRIASDEIRRAAATMLETSASESRKSEAGGGGSVSPQEKSA